MEGCIVSWTVPALGREGFESVLYLEDFTLHVTSPTLEEHVWPTQPEQRVWAEDVTYDSPWEGRTRVCILVEEKKEENPSVHFEDLPVDKIVGFKKRVESVLSVFLEAKAEVVCVDTENSKLLLDIGVGGLVQLFNVKVSAQGGVFVTSGSGVRRVQREPIPVAPPSPPLPLGPPTKPTKWICITCNYVNHPGVSVCRGCCLQRKQGPLKGSAWNFRFDSIPRRQFKRFPQWRCLACGHRDNFEFAQNDCCVKCGATRKEDQRSKKKSKKGSS